MLSDMRGVPPSVNGDQFLQLLSVRVLLVQLSLQRGYHHVCICQLSLVDKALVLEVDEVSLQGLVLLAQVSQMLCQLSVYIV